MQAIPSADMPSQSPSDNDESFRKLMNDARRGNTEALGRLLQHYSNYLRILASTQLDRRIRRRVNPSDVVQEAMLAAHRDFGDFRGETSGEMLCWLRTILVHALHRSFIMHVGTQKRDVRRETSLDQLTRQFEESACNLASLLPAKGDSPSAQLQKRDREAELAKRLSKLKPAYRDVIVLRVLQGMSFEDIAEQMERSCGAVRMLWLRALERLQSDWD